MYGLYFHLLVILALEHYLFASDSVAVLFESTALAYGFEQLLLKLILTGVAGGEDKLEVAWLRRRDVTLRFV